MPTYEYACEACGNSWEAEQRITEDALKDCPKCGQPKARRLISGSRFMLKGGGWYADGYGSSSKSSGGSDSSKSVSKSSESKPSDASSSESKPAESKSSESKPSSSSSD